MKKIKWIIILVNLIILLVVINNLLLKKEVILNDAQLVLLDLAPVDPRSLMQGDYMILRYDISNNVDAENIPRRGFCVVKLNENGVAKKVRIQAAQTPLHDDEIVIGYTSRNWNGINIGAESFFFQEGDAEKYEKAKFGGLKVDKQGNSILIGLFDENRELIE